MKHARLWMSGWSVFFALALIPPLLVGDAVHNRSEATEPASEDDFMEVEMTGFAYASPDSVEQVQVVGLEELRAWAVKDAIHKAVEWALRETGISPDPRPDEGVTGVDPSSPIRSERVGVSAQRVLDSYTVVETVEKNGEAMARVKVRLDRRRMREAGLDRLRVLPVIGVESGSEIEGVLPQELRSELIAHLSGQGMQLLEPSGGMNLVRDPAVLAEIGREHRADLILIAGCHGRELDKMGDFSRMNYRVELRLIAGYTGRSLAEKRFHHEPPRNYMVEQMEKDAAVQLADEVAAFTLETLKASENSLITRRIRVCGLSGRWQAEQVRDALRNQDEIDGVRLLLYEVEGKGCAYLEAAMSARMSERIGFALERLAGLRLRVVGESPSWIEAETY